MKRRPRRLFPDEELKKPVKKFEDTFSGQDAVMDWLKQNNATESRTFDEETGEPMRTFTIKLK
jgi:hypothetical protein